MDSSSYAARWPFTIGHVQTVFPSLFRRVPGVSYQRERIDTPDGDFLDLDWSRVPDARGVAVISHGLEGSSDGHYVRGMTRALKADGWDVLAWNLRGCSGEPNRAVRFYHSGATDDLDTVVRHVLAVTPARKVALVGFSLGGNLTLKYLGERGDGVSPRLWRAVAFSVPCDLRSSSLKLGRLSNRLYMVRFLLSLRRKIRDKKRRMPHALDDAGYWRLRTFRHFDDRYTAPLHGFRDAEDYWRQASSRPYLERIRIPTLLVNARNDPFLAPECFPVHEAEASPWLYLEMPASGGHVGFVTTGDHGVYWSEGRAVEFLRAPIPAGADLPAAGSKPERS